VEKGKRKEKVGLWGWMGGVVVMVMEVEYGLVNEWMNERALFYACFI